VPNFNRYWEIPLPSLSNVSNIMLDTPYRPLLPKTKYKYQPLLPGEDIRILRLLPGEEEDPIICQLIPSTLISEKDEPLPIQYEALSYYWGTDEARNEIRIRDEGFRFPEVDLLSPESFYTGLGALSSLDYQGLGRDRFFYLKSNLFAALRNFRDPSRDIFFWVDAICINQDDDNEKNNQVAKMQEIYNKATNVCIWLGPASPTSDLAFDFVKEVLDLGGFDKLVRTELSRDKWIALAELMRNRWFSRRWVIQELALARNATLHCGDQVVHWSDFADAVALFVTKLDQIKQLFPQSRPFSRPYDILENILIVGANVLVHVTGGLFRKSPDGEVLERLCSIESLVSTLMAFEASDPKDTVYAVLSLAKEDSENKIVPDYKKDLTEVYIDFIRSCVESSRSLDIICRHWAPVGASQDPELPSWIPPISGSAFGAPEVALNGRVNGDSLVGNPERHTYNAALGFPPASVRFGVVQEGESAGNDRRGKYDGTMHVEGFRIDPVAELGPRAAEGLIFRECLAMGGWIPDQGSKPVRVPDELWRTLVADRSPDGSNPPSWYHRACLYCLAKSTATGDINTDALIKDEESPEMMVQFLKRVQNTIWNRKFFRSRNGIKGKKLFGLAPPQTTENDFICILHGCSVPVILRQTLVPEKGSRKRRRGTDAQTPIGNGGCHFKFIGECYVYGMMDGEARDIKEQHLDTRTEVFELR
jgi:hypothetical protein